MNDDLEFRAVLAAALLGFAAHRGYHLRRRRAGGGGASIGTRRPFVPRNDLPLRDQPPGDRPFRDQPLKEQPLEDQPLEDQPMAAAILAVPAIVATLAFLAYPPAIAWASFPAPAWLRWSGVAVALAGFALLSWAQRSLGGLWSAGARLQPRHELIETGPYRWIAHPIYSAFLLILGSTWPISANLVVGPLWLAVATAEIVPRIRREEALLAAGFGERYDAYRAAVGRLLPRLRPRSRRTP